MLEHHYVELLFQNKSIKIECLSIDVTAVNKQPIVFLHEGLGSVSLWKDFPEKLCHATGRTGLVYSRYGYGKSTAKPPEEYWPVDFMHTQAREVLPQLLSTLNIQKPWLFGHSDGASIALLFASMFPDEVTGLILLAPHVFVEDITIKSIEQAREAYLHTDLKSKLAQYHADPDSAFWGWNNIWLNPEFRYWNIEQELATVNCPTLVVQGLDDEYGTLAQIEHIGAAIPAKKLVLPQCKHSPHSDQPELLLAEVKNFIR